MGTTSRGFASPMDVQQEEGISPREHFLSNARKLLPRKLLASMLLSWFWSPTCPRANPCDRELGCAYAYQLKPVRIHPRSGARSASGATWSWGENPKSVCILLLRWRQIATKWGLSTCNNVKHLTEYLLCERYCAMLFLIIQQVYSAVWCFVRCYCGLSAGPPSRRNGVIAVK